MVRLHEAAVLSRVLVVDDDPAFAGFVCAIAEREAVRPAVSMTGADALRRLALGHWAGVLLDLRLPDSDGLAVLTQLRQMGSRVPVIVMAGAGNVPAAVKAMKLGAMDFLEKPVSATALATALRALLDEAWTDGRTDRSQLWAPERVLTLARVVARFVDSLSDVRTAEALCRASGVFLSPRTFRAWCLAEGVRAGALLDLARVLRAVRMAHAHGCRLEECLEADQRTIRALLHRSGCRSAWSHSSTTWADLCSQQRCVRHTRLVEAISRLLADGLNRFPHQS